MTLICSYRPLVLLLAMSGFLFASGCREQGPPIAAVSGTITFQGKPVTHGEVVFMSPKGFGCSALIDPQGAYSLRSQYGKGIPHGNYKVAVAPPVPPGNGTDINEKQIEMLYPDFPKKYRDFGTSGLEVTIGEQPTVFDINMEAK